MRQGYPSGSRTVSQLKSPQKGEAKESTPRRLRRMHGVHTLIWIGPGAAVSWFLRNSVPWVTFMSWYAIVMTSIDGW